MKEAKNIVVVALGCDDLIVIVRNPTGPRLDWQFPGSRLNEDEKPLDGVVRVCRDEIGVVVTPDMARQIKQFTLKNEWGTKTFTSFFVRVTGTLLSGVGQRGPRGHAIMIIQRREMAVYLMRKQRALLVPA